jgi:hypothetical protein
MTDLKGSPQHRNNHQRSNYVSHLTRTPIKRSNIVTKDLAPIIEKVRKLQDLTRSTGFHTSRSIGALLANLTPEELVVVSEGLDSANQQR